jgi:hypothetical protein
MLGSVGQVRIVTDNNIYDPNDSTITVPTADLQEVTGTQLLLLMKSSDQYGDDTGNNTLSVYDMAGSTTLPAWTTNAPTTVIPTTWTFGTDGNLTLPPSGDILIDGGANSAIHDLIQNDVHTSADHYTLALSDRGKMIYQTGGYSVLVPTNSTTNFPVGSVVTIINSGGAGILEIAAVDGGDHTDIYGAGTDDTNSAIWALPSNSIATIIKVESDGVYAKWLLSGVGIYDNS